MEKGVSREENCAARIRQLCYKLTGRKKGGRDMKHILLVISIAVLVFAFSTNTVGQELGVQFDLKLGQQVTVQNTGLTLIFTSVDNDSRCPEGAKCVWPGNAKVTIVVSQKEIKLNTHSDPKQATYSDYILRLVTLSPYPKLNEQINPKDYVARLIVTKK